MTTAREIAHRHLRCRGGKPHPHGDGDYNHTKTCDALTADIEAALERSFESGRESGLDTAEMLADA